jgi:acyl-coenzyme A thioesterase PaaI-like protein
MSGSTARNSLFPITQTNVEKVFGYIFAPWVKELGFKDFTVSEGYCSVILPLSSKVKFVTGSMCGQAIMAGIDTASGLASGTTERIEQGQVCDRLDVRPGDYGWHRYRIWTCFRYN